MALKKGGGVPAVDLDHRLAQGMTPAATGVMPDREI